MTSSKKIIRRLKFRFMLMQFLLWFTFGTFGMFYVAYLRELGYSSKFIALGLTLATIAGIGAQYFWGYISDLTSRIKTIFLCLLVAMILIVTVFPLAVKYSTMTIVIMILFGITWMPLEALLDSWLLSTDDLPHSEYGTIRSGGSLGFAIVTVIFGSLIVRFGFRVSILAFALSGTLLFVTALTTRGHASKVPTPMGLKQIRQLLTNPRYVGILLYSILIFINHMGINNFYIYIVQAVGGDEKLLGMAASVAAFAEIIGFIIGGKIQKRIKPLTVMLVVAIGYFFRIFLLSQSASFIGVLFTAALQGLLFSIFLGTFKLYISDITSIDVLATAQTIAASTYFGIASIIANIVGGILIDDYGMVYFYRFLTMMSGVAVVYILILWLVEQRRDKRNAIHTT